MPNRAMPDQIIFALVGACSFSSVPVRAIERFFYAITVVNINVNVEHALVVFEQLKNREHDIIDVAESTRFALLRVMQSSCPVDDVIIVSMVESNGTTHRSPRVQLAKVKESIEDGAVISDADIEAFQVAHVLMLIFRVDETQELDVVIAMELHTRTHTHTHTYIYTYKQTIHVTHIYTRASLSRARAYTLFRIVV